MYNLMFIDDKFVLSGTSKEDTEPVKAIPGSNWSHRLKAWTWKPDYKTYKQIKISFPDVNITEEVKIWIQKHLKGIQRLKAIKSTNPMNIASNDKLYPFQKVGTNFAKIVRRGIIADDMGLGKTAESIIAAEEVNAQYILVITLNSVKFTWEGEILKWGTKPVTIVNGTKQQREKQFERYAQQGGYLVIHYEGVRIEQDILLDAEWDVIIVDEAHRIKNRDAQHTMVCKRLNSKYCWLLTGTPMENSPQELWSLLNMLFPDSFSSYWKFVEQYCVIQEFNRDDKTVRVPVGAISEKEIHELLEPIMIRRLKEEVLPELPEKQYVTIPVEMDKEDRRVYKDILKEMISVTNTGEIVVTPTVLTQYTRLKQVCITQHIFDTNRVSVRITSAKLDALEDLIESCITDHKIVVYTCFAEALEIVRNNLQSRGWKTVEIYGKINAGQRELNKKLFINDPSVRICLCTIQAGGTGLDGLQYAADIEIFLDKHPNPQKNNQAEDRLLRIGQKNAITVYSIINKDSIEEYVEYKLMMKEMTFNRIIDGQYTFLEKYMDNISKNWRCSGD